MATAEITNGAIRAIMSDQVDRETFHPILQVLDVRTLKGSDRYRLVCSDSVHYTQCMAASQLNKLIAAGQLDQGSLIKLEKYLVNKLQTHQIIIVLNFQVVSQSRAKIGAPTDFHKEQDSSATRAPRIEQQPALPPQHAYPALPLQQPYQPQPQPQPQPRAYEPLPQPHAYQPPPRQNGFQPPMQQPAYQADQQPLQLAYQQQPLHHAHQQPSLQHPHQQPPPQQHVYQAHLQQQTYQQAPQQEAYQHQQHAYQPQPQQGYKQQRTQFRPPQQVNPAVLHRQPLGSSLAQNSTDPQSGALFHNKKPFGATHGIANEMVNSIASLNPYMQRFTIRARVTSKGQKKEWNKPTSQGQLFSVDLADKSGEIRGTLFRDLVDRYCDVLQEGTMYKITDTSARIKPANKQWTSLSHQYEINFGNAVFEDCDDDSSIPLINCSFIKLSELPQHAPDEKVDIVAIVKSAEPVTSFISKRDNAERKKREVTIVDDSGCDVRLTFWGDVGTKPDEFWAYMATAMQAHPVVLSKGCRISSFGGVSLSTSFGGLLKFDMPNEPETARLRQWWHDCGSELVTTSLTSGPGANFAPAAFSQRGVIDDIRSKGLGFDEKPSYITFKATLNFIKIDRMWYEACSNAGCQKKVTANSDGTWHCEKCGTTLETCRHRFMLTASFIDHTGVTWATAFNDSASIIFNSITADQIAQYKEEVENHVGVFDDYIKGFFFKQFVIKARVKNETWQEQSRIKTSVVSIAPIDFVEESRQLLLAINDV